jgi:glutamate 5-kinase
VLLSDVDGLYDGDPRLPGAQLLSEVDAPTDLEAVQVARPGEGSLGRGGMATKITAAAMAAAAGIPVLLAAAEDVTPALDASETGPKVGTAFQPSGRRMSARRFWLRHAADVHGSLDLDAGAVAAVIGRRRSLLAAGIHGISGDFVAGDVVDLVGPHGVVVARGVVGFDATELPALIGRRSRDLAPEQRREVVHADDLVPVTTP